MHGHERMFTKVNLYGNSTIDHVMVARARLSPVLHSRGEKDGLGDIRNHGSIEYLEHTIYHGGTLLSSEGRNSGIQTN